GSKIKLQYEKGEVYLSVKIQEVFGILSTPKIANGNLPIIFKLLSPANRPIQITKDLFNFWTVTYNDVKKELKGKYPKHVWPLNPLEEKPTKFTKNRNK
ncbi:MAG: ATP-dependent helicase HrpB, partial [Leptospiraceae bacterium]|nr:ATP-dependent helicase HrpB [Leptospiraceae bacterium]